MHDFNEARYLRRRALALAGILALITTVLVLALGLLEPGDARRDSPELGGHAEPFSPTPSQDLEALYRQAWVAVRDNLADESKLADWQKWEHKFDGRIRTERQLREAIQEMLASLGDKHTHYVSAHVIREFEYAVNGKIVGIGITITDEFAVNSVQPNGPAAKAGLRKGDVILSVDGEPTAAHDLKKVVSLIRGDARVGSKVVIWVAREGKPARFEIERAVVQTTAAVRSNTMWGPWFDPSEGNSLKIDNMRSESVVDETAKEIDSLNKKGVTALVLDLRGINGGSGETAARIAALFLENGPVAQSLERVDGLIETTQYEVVAGKLIVTRIHPARRTAPQEIATPVHAFKGALVVITDDKTSGAAELVAAALKENKRAVVVGIKTKGKSSGQRTVYLNGKHAIRLTSLTYFTGQGSAFETTGITPDVVVAEGDRQWIFEKGMSELKKIAPPPAPKK